MKRPSTTYVIRELQIKTAVRCHYTPIRVAKNPKHLTTPDVGDDTAHQKPSPIVGSNARGTVWQFLTKLNIR